MLRILFVCTGNTCRSPMAAALFAAKAAAGQAEIAADSAGISAWDGMSATAAAQLAMKEYGLTLSEHRSKQLKPQQLEEADLVLTMTAGHKELLTAHFAAWQEKYHTLAEFAGDSGDISDPFGGDLAVYRICAGEIAKKIDGCWSKFLEMAGKTD